MSQIMLLGPASSNLIFSERGEKWHFTAQGNVSIEQEEEELKLTFK